MNQLEKYLIVKGCAGLGNRLFTIAEAVFYAKQTNRELYVDWSDGQFGELDQNVFYNYFNLHSFHHYQNFPEALETEIFQFILHRIKIDLKKRFMQYLSTRIFLRTHF